MNAEPYTAADRELARAILRYLEAHPEAKDTVEGIAQWVAPAASGTSAGSCKSHGLCPGCCSQCLILEIRRPGVPPYYQRHPQRREAITRFLEGT